MKKAINILWAIYLYAIYVVQGVIYAFLPLNILSFNEFCEHPQHIQDAVILSIPFIFIVIFIASTFFWASIITIIYLIFIFLAIVYFRKYR